MICGSRLASFDSATSGFIRFANIVGGRAEKKHMAV